MLLVSVIDKFPTAKITKKKILANTFLLYFKTKAEKGKHPSKKAKLCFLIFSAYQEAREYDQEAIEYLELRQNIFSLKAKNI